MSQRLRQLQFTSSDGTKKIIEHKEALKIVDRLVQTQIAKEAMIAGITFIADGGEYNLLD